MNFGANTLTFIKNEDKQFIMPVDNKKKWYPFVGLKYEGDRIQIIE